MSDTLKMSIHTPKEILLAKYVESLSEKEFQAYNIAKSHLGTSFSLEKSRGFIEWKKKIEINNTESGI